VPQNGSRAPGSADTLVRELAARDGERRTLDSVVQHAVEYVPGCRWAGITIRQQKRLQTLASTDALVDEVDQLQYELSEGPCVDALLVEGSYLIHDMSTEERWPRWAPRADERGAHAALSVRLSSDGQTVGGLNLYGDEPRAFDDDDVEVAHAYADTAAAVIAVSHRIEGLETALRTRHTIGLAQGVLRHRHGLGVDDAFQVLVRVSRQSNVRLRDLATEVVQENGLPPRYLDPGAPPRR